MVPATQASPRCALCRVHLSVAASLCSRRLIPLCQAPRLRWPMATGSMQATTERRIGSAMGTSYAQAYGSTLQSTVCWREYL